MVDTTAAVLRQLNSALSIEKVELDEPRVGEALVRLSAAGICHSDRHFITGHRSRKLPVILGHEGAGIVEAIGPGTTKVRPGDRVVFTFIPSCGRCANCLRGRTATCVRGMGAGDGTMFDGTYRFRDRSGNPIGSGTRLAAFSGHSVVSEDSLVVIGPDVPMTSAALVACGVSTGFGAAVNCARIEPGDSVAVFGLGGVGFAALQGATIAGAGKVVGVDIVDSKLAQAMRFGATHTVNARSTDPVEAIREITDGNGADRSILCVDHVRPENITVAVDCLNAGGVAVLVGASSMEETTMKVAPAALVRSQKTITGTLSGGLDARRDIVRCLDLYTAGRLRLDELVTRTYPLERINDAFDDMVAGRNIRGVVDYEGSA